MDVLSRLQIKRAVKLNKFWFNELNVSSDWFDEETPEGIVKELSLFQKRAGLTIDGIYGPRTHKEFRGGKDTIPNAVDYIVLDGKRVPINARVLDFSESGGLSLLKHRGSFKRRAHPIERIVLHWDVTRSALQTFNVLVARNRRQGHVGTHFCIDSDGVIYQFLDPVKYVSFHAAGNWKKTIGVDLNNPVRLDHTQRGVDRPTIHPEEYGIRLRSPYARGFLGYARPQLDAARELLHVLCESTGVDNVPPKEEERYKVIDNIKERNGVFGHLNVDTLRRGKWDTIYGHVKLDDDSIISAWEYICGG